MKIVTLSMAMILLGSNSIVLAQICKDKVPRTAPDSRYALLGDGSEVKDKQTGLIWQRCSLGQTWNGASCTGNVTSYTWTQALKAASDLGQQGNRKLCLKNTHRLK